MGKAAHDHGPAEQATESQLEVLISAIEHYAYCPRQCALIHVEQTFDENHLHHARPAGPRAGGFGRNHQRGRRARGARRAAVVRERWACAAAPTSSSCGAMALIPSNTSPAGAACGQPSCSSAPRRCAWRRCWTWTCRAAPSIWCARGGAKKSLLDAELRAETRSAIEVGPSRARGAAAAGGAERRALSEMLAHQRLPAVGGGRAGAPARPSGSAVPSLASGSRCMSC